MDSHFHYDASYYHKPLNQVPITSFFGSVSKVQATPELSSTVGDVEAFLSVKAFASEAVRATAAATESVQGNALDMALNSVARSALEVGLPPSASADVVALGPVQSGLLGGVGSGVYFGMVILTVAVACASAVEQ